MCRCYNSVFSTLCTALLAGLGFHVLAQENAVDRNNLTYRQSLELYDHHIYADAAYLFGKVSGYNEASSTTDPDEEQLSIGRINAAFYEALSELQLGRSDAEQKLLGLIRMYPYTPLASQADTKLGFYHFSQSDFSRAVQYFKRPDGGSSDPWLQDEHDFKLAYALFRLDRTDEAAPLLRKLSQKKGQYQEDALYYSAHINYENKEYESALSDLKKITQTSRYAQILPVYSGQIYLLKGDLKNARKVSDSAVTAGSKYSPLLAKVLGSVDFFEADFPGAVREFDIFKSSTYSKQETNQDIYQIGYSYYKVGSYDKAITELGELYDKQDIYAQSGLYTLGQAYLRLKQNEAAKSAFQLASSLTGNTEINQNALVYYAKLSYDAGLDNDALQASKTFIKNYPKAAGIGEIKTLQAGILLNAHNYSEAYETLKGIPPGTGASEKAHQKVAYFFGIEKFNDNNPQDALTLLTESLLYDADPEYTSLALYWKAECEYNLKDYQHAVIDYQSFLRSPAALRTGLINDGLYGAGYSSFKLSDFTTALASFGRFAASDNKDPVLRSDVTQRMADCFFMLKNYTKAKALYLAGSSNKATGADYALYQTGIIQGLQNDQKGKTATLKKLLNEYPASVYASDAQYEIAYGDLVAGRLEASKAGFNELLAHYPTSSTIPRVIGNLGLIAYNANDDKTALDLYKQVVSRFPGSPESRNALAAIKNIYIDKGTPEEFIAYANTSGLTKLSQTSEDSITYQAATSKYLSGDMAASVTGFDAYLAKFNSGYFASDAHYYRSQALVRLKRSGEAVSDYEYLMTRSTNNAYTEAAVSQAASLYVSQGKCDKAVPLLRRLESAAHDKENTALARSDLAACYFKLSNPDSAQYFARSLMALKDIPVQELTQAQLISAKCLLLNTDTLGAEKPLALASKQRNIYAAEARYLTALIEYRHQKYKASMATIFELSKQLASYDYWVAKGFVLLSDNYQAQKDVFQARSTLLSIVRNYRTNDDVRSEAEQKLNALQAKSK